MDDRTPSTVRTQLGPRLIIFFSSACIMVVELVAGRLIARHLGSSLYTWTSIIAVVLAGMSLGNYLGGRLADRFRPERFLGWLFLLASLACLSTLLLNNLCERHLPLAGVVFPARVFLSVVFIFLLPALVLGTISPATAKMALDRSDTVGATLGSVYAWGAIGSIVGTLGTGFFFISALGTKGVVLYTVLALALVGLGLGPKRLFHAVWVAVVLGLVLLSASGTALGRTLAFDLGVREGWRDSTGEWRDYHFARDSRYQLIKVYPNTDPATGRRAMVLALDYLIHGYVDPDDPTYLRYGYEQLYRDIALRGMTGKTRVAALYLGGGSYTFPRWVAHRWPGSTGLVAEIDPLVLEANHAALGLPRNTPIQTICQDARMVVRDLEPRQRFDLVFADAFSDLSIPFHLTTLEFYQELAAHMTPDGLLLQNIIDDYQSGLMLGATVATLGRVFRHVQVFSTEVAGLRLGRSTYVVASSNRPIPVADWQPGHPGPLTGSALTRSQIITLLDRSGHRVLTDDDAPVENLILPVVRARGQIAPARRTSENKDK